MGRERSDLVLNALLCPRQRQNFSSYERTALFDIELAQSIVYSDLETRVRGH